MARPRIRLTDGEISQAQEMLKAGKDVDEIVILGAICLHAKICTPEICKFRKA